MPDALLNAVRLADRDAAVRAIVVICAGRTFIAGADIHELERAAWDDTAPLPDFHPLLAAIEDCSKPVVMALHGTALGGGVEVAMAGHYRIAVADARLGLPEANLGIIPGAEGTQRLPRLVGVEKAIEIVVSGKPIGAADALRAGLIDRVVDGTVDGDRATLSGRAPWRLPGRWPTAVRRSRGRGIAPTSSARRSRAPRFLTRGPRAGRARPAAISRRRSPPSTRSRRPSACRSRRAARASASCRGSACDPSSARR